MSARTELPVASLEALWEKLAVAITAVGPERESVFLGKVALLLANECAQVDRVFELIDIAARDL